MVWKSLNFIATLLDPVERQQVLGDIQERGANFQALTDLVGLVARRQLLAYTSWKTWLAIVALALPALAITLSIRAIAATASYYPWPDLGEGSRIDFAWMIANSAIATFVLTWSAGYALASIARHRSPAAVAVLVLAATVLSSIPLLLSTAPHSAWGRALAYFLLAILPGALGIRRGWLGVPLARRGALVLAAACIPFAFLLPNSPFWSARIISVVAFWPAYFAVGVAVKGRPSHA
jgi:hypothetical protein